MYIWYTGTIKKQEECYLNLITTFDHGILNWIQLHVRCDFLDSIMPWITNLGEAGAIWILIAILLVLHKPTRRWGIALGIVLLAGLLLGELGMKHLIQRIRPCNLPDAAVSMLISPPNSFSFPSGHTMSSFEAATVLFLARHRWGIYAYGLSALIAFSRMYLYVHFPTDVLAGAILGILLAYGMIMLFLRKGWLYPLKNE